MSSAFLPSVDIGYWSVIYTLCNSEVCSWYTRFLEGLYHEGAFSLIKCFPHTHGDGHMVSALHPADVICDIHWFSRVDPPLHLWDKSLWIVVRELWDAELDPVCLYFFLLRIVACMLVKEIGLSFSVCVVSSLGSGVRVPSLSIFWNNLGSTGVSSSLNVL